MQFGTWLKTARVNARNSGVDLRGLATYPVKLTLHVQERMFYARLGLEKLHVQLPSTLLGEDQQRERWIEHREQFIGDVKAVLTDIASVLVAVGCTDEELAAAGVIVEPTDPAPEADLDQEDAPEPDESSEKGDESSAPDDAETVQMPIAEIKGKTDTVKEK